VADLVPMPPRARAVILETCALRGLDPIKVAGKCRINRFVWARIEISRALDALGYSSPQIGKFLGGHDHTTVLYYLGRGKKKPPRPKWRAPKVRHVRFIRVKKPVKPKRYLIPYAGADMTDYVWTPQPQQEQRA
jgi:hypothetical protein